MKPKTSKAVSWRDLLTRVLLFSSVKFIIGISYSVSRSNIRAFFYESYLIYIRLASSMELMEFLNSPQLVWHWWLFCRPHPKGYFVWYFDIMIEHNRISEHNNQSLCAYTHLWNAAPWSCSHILQYTNAISCQGPNVFCVHECLTMYIIKRSFRYCSNSAGGLLFMMLSLPNVLPDLSRIGTPVTNSATIRWGGALQSDTHLSVHVQVSIQGMFISDE